jgi:predicted Na+-dependent transporter
MSVQQTNRFWSASLEHTLFFDFLILFVNMHLAVSFAGKKNAFFELTDQKLWMFEVSRRSLGRAGMFWSQ